MVYRTRFMTCTKCDYLLTCRCSLASMISTDMYVILRPETHSFGSERAGAEIVTVFLRFCMRDGISTEKTPTQQRANSRAKTFALRGQFTTSHHHRRDRDAKAGQVVTFQPKSKMNSCSVELMI